MKPKYRRGRQDSQREVTREDQRDATLADLDLWSLLLKVEEKGPYKPRCEGPIRGWKGGKETLHRATRRYRPC